MATRRCLTAKCSSAPPPCRRGRTPPCRTRTAFTRSYAATTPAYTPEMVERVTGCPQKTFLQIAEAITRNSGRERTTAWCYAVGWTHHTTGVQTIRAATIIQALLGNIGRPGGGILALRGHTSIQGSTDIPTLYNLLPGYLPQPDIYKNQQTLSDYITGADFAHRLAAQLSQIHRQPAARLVRRACRAGERVGLPMAPKDHRRSIPAADDARHPGRHHPRHVLDRPEPGRRRAQFRT